MKMYDLSIVLIAIGAALVLIVSGVACWKLGPTSPITQEAEDVGAELAEEAIDKATGVDIPLEAAVKAAQQAQIQKANTAPAPGGK